MTQPITSEKPAPIYGLFSFTFGFISLFLIAPLFAGLSILFGGIGLLKKQYGWSIIGIILAVIGLKTSFLLWLYMADTVNTNLTLNGTFNSKTIYGHIKTGTERDETDNIRLTID